MENKKFDMAKYKESYDGDDLYIAIENNGGVVDENSLDEFVAEVCGEHDGYNWWWVMKTKEGKFVLLTGGCDYTGWDCQSHLDNNGTFDTAEEAAKASPVEEEYSSRNIQSNLLAQIKGEKPFALYSN